MTVRIAASVAMGLIGACFLLRLIGVDFSGSSSPNCDAATRPQRQHCQRFGTRGNMDTKEGPESDSGQVVRIAVHDLPQAQRHTASINEALAREFWPWEKHKAEAKSRCEFAVVDGSKLTSQEFHQNFVEKEQPALILRSNITRWPAVQTWTYGQLLKSRISDLEFRVGSGPYPKQSLPLQRFIRKWQHLKGHQVFQFGRTPTDFALYGHTRPCRGVYAIQNLADALPMHPDPTAACWILMQTEVPTWLFGTGADGAQVSYAGWLLNTGETGIAFHSHRNAINAVLSGAKLWAIEGLETREVHLNSPPRKHVLDQLRQSHSTLALNLLQNITSQVDGSVDPRKVVVCEQKAGEAVFIPDMAAHGVITTKESAAIQLQFERGHWGNVGIRTALEMMLETAINARDRQKPPTDGS